MGAQTSGLPGETGGAPPPSQTGHGRSRSLPTMGASMARDRAPDTVRTARPPRRETFALGSGGPLASPLAPNARSPRVSGRSNETQPMTPREPACDQATNCKGPAPHALASSPAPKPSWAREAAPGAAPSVAHLDAPEEGRQTPASAHPGLGAMRGRAHIRDAPQGPALARPRGWHCGRNLRKHSVRRRTRRVLDALPTPESLEHHWKHGR